jgi:protein disulfide-isomerase
MRLATTTALGLLLLATAAWAEEAVRWTADYREATAIAARERKLVLLHFESDDCPPCRRLAANVFSRNDVANSLATNFVPVKINVSRNPDMARKYNVHSWPQDVVVTHMGQEVYRQISPQDPAEYVVRLGDAAGRYATIAKSGGAAPAARQPASDRNTVAKASMASEYQPAATDPAAATAPPAQRAAAPQQSDYAAQEQAGPYSAASTKDAQRPANSQVAMDEASEYEGIEHSEVLSKDVAATPAKGDQPGDSPRDAVAPSEPKPSESKPRASELAASPPPDRTPAPAAKKREPLPPLGMEGFCVVSLYEYNEWDLACETAKDAGTPAPENKPANPAWINGDKRWGAIHRGRLYLFASADAQKKFLADPDRYAPAISGYDAVALHETGKLVEGKRKCGVALPGNGQMFLFADETSLAKFRANSALYQKTVYEAMLRSDQVSKLR